jgi:hypothetical protein
MHGHGLIHIDKCPTGTNNIGLQEYEGKTTKNQCRHFGLIKRAG